MAKWLTPTFVDTFIATMVQEGFVSNVHLFTPFARTMIDHTDDIKAALIERGYPTATLAHDELTLPSGHVYFVYQVGRFRPSELIRRVTAHAEQESPIDDLIV
jgi:hypothetical protein